MHAYLCICSKHDVNVALKKIKQKKTLHATLSSLVVSMSVEQHETHFAHTLAQEEIETTGRGAKVTDVDRLTLKASKKSAVKNGREGRGGVGP